MDNIPEKEQPKPERVVSLGEEFQPFDPRYLKREYRREIPREFRSEIVLNTENGLKIHIDINTYGLKRIKGRAITPFEPELGYQIDSEDLKLESRLAKIERLKTQLEQDIDFVKAPLLLSIYMSDSDYTLLYEWGLNKEQIAEYRKEIPKLLRKLRILISFPTSRFEARANENQHLNITDWSLFYPIDSGPLPTSEPPIPLARKLEIPEIGESFPFILDIGEGFSLFLPSDLQKLAQIRARFVLAEEKPEEAQA